MVAALDDKRRHTPRRRGIQYSTGRRDRAEMAQRTGSSAFADDDSGGCGDTFAFQTAHRVQPQLRNLAARCARVMQASFPSREQRAQGMPGARCARSLACKIKFKHTSIVTTVTPETPGIPR